MSRHDGFRLQGLHFIQSFHPCSAISGCRRVGCPDVYIGIGVHVAGNGFDRWNPDVRTISEPSAGAANLDGFAFQGQGVALHDRRYNRGFRCVCAHLWSPECNFLRQFFLNRLDDCRRADNWGAWENVVQYFRAEVVIRVGLADDDGFELFAAVQYIGGDAVGVAARKAGVEQDGFFLAADQGGIHAKAAGRGVVHGNAQIVFALCECAQ